MIRSELQTLKHAAPSIAIAAALGWLACQATCLNPTAMWLVGPEGPPGYSGPSLAPTSLLSAVVLALPRPLIFALLVTSSLLLCFVAGASAAAFTSTPRVVFLAFWIGLWLTPHLARPNLFGMATELWVVVGAGLTFLAGVLGQRHAVRSARWRSLRTRFVARGGPPARQTDAIREFAGNLEVATELSHERIRARDTGQLRFQLTVALVLGVVLSLVIPSPPEWSIQFLSLWFVASVLAGWLCGQTVKVRPYVTFFLFWLTASEIAFNLIWRFVARGSVLWLKLGGIWFPIDDPVTPAIMLIGGWVGVAVARSRPRHQSPSGLGRPK